MLASWVSLAGNTVLAATKIVAGIVSGSLAVLGDGIDSSVDVLISLVSVIAARIISKPPDKKYAYGYEKVDSIASKVISFFIFFAAAQLGFSTIKRLFIQQQVATPSMLAIYVTLFSIMGKIGLSIYQYAVGKKAQSLMLIANAKNMKYDVMISSTVLISLFTGKYLHFPLADSIAALFISIWIMRAAFEIFMESNTDLMDGVDDPVIYNKIFEAVDEVQGASNPHKVRTRMIGRLYSIVIDIEVDANMSLHRAHEISHQVEMAIRRKIPNIFDIVIHLDPLGTQEKDECFGVNKNNL